LSTAHLFIHSWRLDLLSGLRVCGKLAAVSSVWAAMAGAAAGAGGAMMLRRLPRGVPVPVLACAVLVAGLWGVVGGRADVVGLPLWWWPVPLVLGWVSVLLGGTDLVARRLPDVLTISLYPVVAVLLVVAAIGAANAALLPRAMAGALLWGGAYAVMRLFAPGAIGGGDVKLAGGLGALTAATSWPGLLLAVLAASLVTAVVAVPARVFGYVEIPHGPAMLAAAWLVVLHPPV
jgi:leader peptidase (prepilin peptidase) / N-methyltransferase